MDFYFGLFTTFIVIIPCCGFKTDLIQCTFMEENDHHCVKNSAGKNYCNQTTQCEEGDGCYALWKNSSGEILFKKKGCWPIKDCRARMETKNECVGHHNSNNDLDFCCCVGHLCNAYISNITILDTSPGTTTVSPKGGTTKKYRDHLTHSLLYYTLIPVFGCCIVIAVLIYLWRRHKSSMVGRQKRLPTYSPPPSPAIGSHPVQLESMIAQGQFGSVYKASSIDKTVAVKVFAQQEHASWSTEKEIYTLYDMSHCGILKYIGVDKRKDDIGFQYWIITEYHEHGSLSDYLANNVLSWEQLYNMLLSMVNGLAFLHSDVPNSIPPKPAIAHCDFKSRNVLVKSDLTCCIGDFGLAIVCKACMDQNELRPQVGTKRYMAPEVLDGAITFQRESFMRIDVYALALVMWEMVSRCTATESVFPEYKLPFEEEVGLHPSIDTMQDVVVEKKLRPKIRGEWRAHKGIGVICECMEDCWDPDADARITVHCVFERLVQLHQATEIRNITNIAATSNDDLASSGISSWSLSEGKESTC